MRAQFLEKSIKKTLRAGASPASGAPEGGKMSSTGVFRNLARRMARPSVGSYLSFSMTLMVWRVTPQGLGQVLLGEPRRLAQRSDVVFH